MHALFWALAALALVHRARPVLSRCAPALFALGFAYLQLIDVTPTSTTTTSRPARVAARALAGAPRVRRSTRCARAGAAREHASPRRLALPVPLPGRRRLHVRRPRQGAERLAAPRAAAAHLARLAAPTCRCSARCSRCDWAALADELGRLSVRHHASSGCCSWRRTRPFAYVVGDRLPRADAACCSRSACSR